MRRSVRDALVGLSIVGGMIAFGGITLWLRGVKLGANSWHIKANFADASGLSRHNKLTTYGMTQFLRRMSLNRYSDYYYSSFSILGLRGTISDIKIPNELKDNIIAKLVSCIENMNNIFLNFNH